LFYNIELLDFEYDLTNCVSEAFFFRYRAKACAKSAVAAVLFSTIWIAFVLFALFAVVIMMFLVEA
jgi:hypothetical protein